MRLANRLLATLAAGALAAFSALVAVEIVLGYSFDRGPWLLPWRRWYERSRELVWSDRSVVVTFVLIGVAGVVLLAAELWKRPPMALPLEDMAPLDAKASLSGSTPLDGTVEGSGDDTAARAKPAVHTELNRRSLEHVLGRAALRVDGVSSVHVRSRGRRIRVRAATQRRLPADLRARVTDDVATVLADLRLQRPPRLVVNVDSRRPPRGQV